MSSAPKPSPRGVGGTLLAELKPFDGRLVMSLHIALLCGMTAVLTMTLQVPLALLSCYLIFLMYRDNAGENIVIGVGLILAVTIIIALSVVLMMLVAGSPALRLAMMGGVTFASMWLARASKLGEPAGLLGFILVFILSAYDYIGMPGLVVRALTWVWMVVFVPMVLLAALGMFAGRSPYRLVQKRLRERLEVSAHLLSGGDPNDAEPLLRERNTAGEKHLGMARLLGQVSRESHERMAHQLSASFQLLAVAQSAAVAGKRSPEWSSLLSQLSQGEATAPLPTEEDPVAQAIRAYAEPLATQPKSEQHAAKGTFFHQDAFSNPIYIRFALKVLLAVFLSYTLYTSIGLFEIHTAMVTCFVVALSSSGDTLQKSTLRIIGCLVGVAMGVFSVYFVVPHLSDPGHLFLLITIGSFIAGWVATGSYRVQYAGFQMALAFFICVLPGSPLSFGPNYDLADAGYRILGILVGIAIMGLVFSLIWPEKAGDSRALETDKALASMARVLRGEDTLETVYGHLDTAQHANEVMKFEWPRFESAADAAGAQRLTVALQLAQLLPLMSASAAAPLAAALQASANHERLETLNAVGSDDVALERAFALIHLLSEEGEKA